MIEVQIIGGSHHGEWVNIPDGADGIRILRRCKRPTRFPIIDEDPTTMFSDIEEFDLVPNEHFRGFAQAILRK